MTITNDMRDRMATLCLSFGKSQIEAAKEIGCSQQVVSKTLAILQTVKEGNVEQLEKMLLPKRTGLAVVRWAFHSLGKPFPEEMGDRLTNAWTVAKTQEKPKEEPTSPKVTEQKPISPASTPTGAKVFIPAPTAEVGWQCRLKTNPGKVTMTVYFNGVPVVEGLSKIRANTELDLMRAISYAAHMCYKLTEQKKLKGV